MNPPDDAWLDDLLREELRGPPLPDNGFTLRVLDALPQRHGLPRQRVCLAIAWTIAFAGFAEGLEWSGAWSLLSGSLSALARSAFDWSGGPWMNLVWAAIVGSVMVAWKPIKSVFQG